MILLGFVMIVLSCIGHSSMTNGVSSYHRLCLIDQSDRYRENNGRFTPSDVTDPSLCSHLVYGHALVDGEEMGLEPAGPYEEENYQALTSLKSDNPDLLILLAIGGPDGSQGFDDVVNSTETVSQFAQNTFDFLRQRSFDGVVIDWSPNTVDGDPSEHIDRFATFLEAMSDHSRLDAAQTGLPGLLVGVIISGEKDIIENYLPIEALAKYADLILVKTFDFYTAEIPVIGHQSALYPRNDEEGYFTVLNLDFAVHFLLYLEIPNHKIVVGLPSHGRSLRFVNSSLQYFGAEHAGPGVPGPYSKQEGKLTYYEICDLLTTGWVGSFHESHQVPFAFNDDEMVTFDNERSVVQKVNYVKDNQLGGLFISSLADDDFRGAFCQRQPFPLTRAVKTALMQSRGDCYQGEYGLMDLPGCTPCPIGSFQPLTHQTECIPCPSGYSTLETGSDRIGQCVVDCGSGYEYNFISDSCDICPLGFFRDALVQTHCYRCPDGMTTISKGSSYCVDDLISKEPKRDQNVTIGALLLFDVSSCENEAVVFAAITKTITELVQNIASTWQSLCHQECSNLQLMKQHSCAVKSRGPEATLELKLILNNITMVTGEPQKLRLSKKVLEQALYNPQPYTSLETYGVNFKGLQDVSSNVVCDNGSAVLDGICTECPEGMFHNLTSSGCQKCPLGMYQDKPEMTSCMKCEGVKSTVVSGAISAEQCLSPCEAKPKFCYNGGTCHWTEQDLSALYCQCADGYTGDRCEDMRGEYVDTGVIIGASLGAVLVILVLVLIVVAFVACVRSSKVKKPSITKLGGDSSGLPSSDHRSVWSGKSYPINTSRAIKALDYTNIDYYNWIYFNQHHYLQSLQQRQPLKQLKGSGGSRCPSHKPSALSSPNLSGDTRSIKSVAGEY